MKRIELNVSGNTYGVDYDYQIGSIEIKNNGYTSSINVEFSIEKLDDQIAEFVDDLKELLGADK